jgi:hypothetical protein
MFFFFKFSALYSYEGWRDRLFFFGPPFWDEMLEGRNASHTHTHTHTHKHTTPSHMHTHTHTNIHCSQTQTVTCACAHTRTPHTPLSHTKLLTGFTHAYTHRQTHTTSLSLSLSLSHTHTHTHTNTLNNAHKQLTGLVPSQPRVGVPAQLTKLN